MCTSDYSAVSREKCEDQGYESGILTRGYLLSFGTGLVLQEEDYMNLRSDYDDRLHTGYEDEHTDMRHDYSAVLQGDDDEYINAEDIQGNLTEVELTPADEAANLGEYVSQLFKKLTDWSIIRYCCGD